MARKKKEELESAALLGVAFNQLTDAVEDLIKASKRFVEALSPGAVLLFNQACRDLQATIGQALLPIIEVFTQVIRDSAGIISPVMIALAPIFRQLAQIVGGNLIVILKLLADTVSGLLPILELYAQVMRFAAGLFEAVAAVARLLVAVLTPIVAVIGAVLTPVMEALADGMKGIGEIFSTLAIIVKAFTDALAVAFKAVFAFNPLTSVMENFRRGIELIIRSLVTFAAKLAMGFGFSSVVDNLIKAFSPVGSGAVAAPQDSAIKSFQQIADDLTQSAFIAQGGTSAETDKDAAFKAELLGILKDIKDNGFKLPSLGEVKDEAADLYSWSSFKRGLDTISEGGIGAAYENSSFRNGLRKLGF